MVLANSRRQTWLLVLGDSVYRGIFLMLVDMMLAKGQKDNLSESVIQKCWGYADIRLGNLRLTYQVKIQVEMVQAIFTHAIKVLFFGISLNTGGVRLSHGEVPRGVRM